MSAPITLCGSLSLHAVGLGAAMHEAGYRALDLPWRYVPFELDGSGLSGALTGMRALGIRGLGVSMPFKQQVMPLLDAIDPLAARIGAVNTIVNEGGHLVGHNTDWTGAVRALEEVMSVAGARVLLLGAGGAARAIAHGLADSGAAVTITSRNGSKAASLAVSVGAAFLLWSDRHEAAVDAIVNATSVGMTGESEGLPVDPALLRAPVVMDIVYRPIITELLTKARAWGTTTIHGGRMLLHQAGRQFELYTGRAAPLAAMNAALEQAMLDPAP